MFPTNTNSVKTLDAARADMIAAIQSEAAGDGKLSIEIYNPNCSSCPAGANTGYWARYYSKEAADPSVRPKLVLTYATGIDVTSFTATPTNPVAGVAQVKESDVPAAALFSRDQTTGSTPLADTPLGDTPLADTPLGDTPLGDTPLADTSLGLGDVLAELRTTPLSSLPLLREGGWPAVLTNTALATRALQNVTLGDVLALTPRPPALDGQGTDEIRLEELDLSRSPLGGVAAIAFALGSGVTLGELSGATQLDPDLQRWCIATGTSCPTTSILALGLRGAPLGDTPLGDTPLGDTPLADTPLGDTPLADTPLADTPLGDTPLADTPLGDTPLADTPLGDTPLGDTDLSRAPLGDTPLGDTPLGDTPLADTVLGRAPLGDTPLGDTPLADTPLGDTPLGDTPLADTAICSAVYTFSDCATRGGTLDDHRAQLRPGVTIAEFVAALTQAARERLTLGDLVASLADPDDFTLAQLLAVLPLPTDYTLAHVVAVLTDAAGLTILDLVNSLPNANDFTLDDLLAAVLRATAELGERRRQPARDRARLDRRRVREPPGGPHNDGAGLAVDLHRRPPARLDDPRAVVPVDRDCPARSDEPARRREHGADRGREERF